eukprot:m.38646 g.38646  ORF g.38646 m.38646 type:complete len:295 (+) comp10218_c0_seq1:295-1179(+)
MSMLGRLVAHVRSAVAAPMRSASTLSVRLHPSTYFAFQRGVPSRGVATMRSTSTLPTLTKQCKGVCASAPRIQTGQCYRTLCNTRGAGWGMANPALRACARRFPSSSVYLAQPVRTKATALVQISKSIRPLMYITAASAVVAVGAYMVYRTTVFMGSLNFKHITKFGFYLGGVFSTLLVFGIALLWRKYGMLHPDRLHQCVLTRIAGNRLVMDKLGANLYSSKFRAYYATGGFQLKRKFFVLPFISYQPRGLQLLFQLQGSKSSAMCSVDAYATGRSKDVMLKSLALDFDDGDR